MTNISQVDPDLVAMMNAVFADHRASLPVSAQQAEFDAGLWKQLDSLGLTRLTGAPDAGGSGASWRESAALLRAAARHAVSLPLLESDLLAGWMLEQAGLCADERIRTACILDAAGEARSVAWAGLADHIAVCWQIAGDHWGVADVPREKVIISHGFNLAGERRDRVQVDTNALEAAPVSGSIATGFYRRGALGRTVQVAAALEKAVELCVDYAAERVQFGRPLAHFQSIQRLVAQASSEAVLARAATDAAVEVAATSDDLGTSIEQAVAVAKSCSGHAAEVVVRNAHQLHGALGTTFEHSLHEFTTPALAWRSEFGSLRHWDEVLLQRALTAGKEGVWSFMINEEGAAQ